MPSYADYTYYINTYLGTSIVSADFPRFALRASEVLDQLTFERAAAIVAAGTDTALIDLIKMANCKLAESYQTEEQDGFGGGIQSESIGSSSVSYAKGAHALKSSWDRMSQDASIYLGSSGLMFRGFESGEYGGLPDAD
jgi:hypothetical protein